jgi:hypothetical protein
MTPAERAALLQQLARGRGCALSTMTASRTLLLTRRARDTPPRAEVGATLVFAVPQAAAVGRGYPRYARECPVLSASGLLSSSG